MNGPEISLIIPVYNGEKHLPELFECVKNQTFKDFELILVNDGSSDHSLDICTSFAQEDERVRLIDKPNGGASSARNAGLNAARARWIVFADCDDLIGIDYLKNLFDVRAPNGVANCGFYEIANGKTKVSVDFGLNNYSVSEGNFISVLDDVYLFTHPSPIARIFDNDIISGHNIRFNEDVTLCEDLLFWMSYALKCNTIKTYPPIQYLYQKDNSYLTQRKTHFDSMYSLCAGFNSLMDEFLKLYGNPTTYFIHQFRATLLVNAVFSIYNWPSNRANRILNLKKILTPYRRIIRQYYHPNSPYLRVMKWLLISSPAVFDSLMSSHTTAY